MYRYNELMLDVREFLRECIADLKRILRSDFVGIKLWLK
jgi:hypothetical protein